VFYLTRSAKGVDLRLGPAALTLLGRHQLHIRLTHEDIVRFLLEIQPELRSSLEAVFEKPESPVEAAE
jgi:hypothetical protein